MHYRIILAVFFMLLFKENISYASLVEANDQKFGNNSITIDTSTQLEWLDLTVSTGMSYSYVNSQFHSGGYFYGYRYATEDEVLSLFDSAGIPIINGSYDIANNTSSIALINLIGATDYGMFYPEAIGVLGTTTYSGNQKVASITNALVCDTVSDTVLCGSGYAVNMLSTTNPDSFNINMGHWLVRDASVVPIPSSLWLFVSGLFGLSRVRKKMR